MPTVFITYLLIFLGKNQTFGTKMKFKLPLVREVRYFGISILVLLVEINASLLGSSLAVNMSTFLVNIF